MGDDYKNMDLHGNITGWPHVEFSVMKACHYAGPCFLWKQLKRYLCGESIFSRRSFCLTFQKEVANWRACISVGLVVTITCFGNDLEEKLQREEAPNVIATARDIAIKPTNTKRIYSSNLSECTIVSCSTGRREWNLFPFPKGNMSSMVPEHSEGTSDSFWGEHGLLHYCLCQRNMDLSEGNMDLQGRTWLVFPLSWPIRSEDFAPKEYKFPCCLLLRLAWEQRGPRERLTMSIQSYCCALAQYRRLTIWGLKDKKGHHNNCSHFSALSFLSSLCVCVCVGGGLPSSISD